MRTYRWCGIAAGVLALGALLGRPAAASPEYVVEPCCNLCPQAGNRSLYTTRFLQSVQTLVQGRDGWLFRTDDDMRSTFGPTEEGYAELKRFRDALKKRGVELVMVYQPTRGLMHPDKLPASVKARYNQQVARLSYAVTLQRFRKLGITVPNLESLLHQRATEPYFFRGDHHWTPYGAQRTAQIVAEAVKAMPAFAALPKKRFVTEKAGMWGKRGTLQRAATQLCGFGYAEQFVPRFVTTAEGETDLFADEGAPQVTLVGTSNSDNAYNFAGFLSEYLGVDILNEAVTGGGHEGALLQYLPSEAFQKTPPRILIWELETYHNLSKEMFYRQVVPLVTDGCRSKKALLSRQTPLKAGNTEVLFNGGGAVQQLRSGGHLFDIKFSDPAIKEFKGVVWYTNGSKESISMEHSDYIETGGRFVVEMRDHAEWKDRTFLSLDVALPEGAKPGTTVTAQVCARDDVAAAAPAPAPPKKKGQRT